MTTLGSVGTISSSGIGSGLDVEGIVTKLMAIEQRPLTLLQSAASGIQTGITQEPRMIGFQVRMTFGDE